VSLVNSAPLYNAIEADAVAAWDVTSVEYGKPRIETDNYPYAVVALDSVMMEPAGVTTIEQRYTFNINYVDKWNTSDPTWNLELTKQDKANALIARLLSGTTYGTVGLVPQINSVIFAETDDPNLMLYEVMIAFEVIQIVEAIV